MRQKFSHFEPRNRATARVAQTGPVSAGRDDLRLRWNLAALVFEARLALWRDHFAQKYSPNQPRVPSGDPRGGQWTRVGGGIGGGAGGVGYSPYGGGGEGGDVGAADVGADAGDAGSETIADFSSNIGVGAGETSFGDPDGTVQLAANDGTPGNNQAQNKQINDIARMVGLDKDQRKQLHLEISGMGLGFHEILAIARGMKK